MKRRLFFEKNRIIALIVRLLVKFAAAATASTDAFIKAPEHWLSFVQAYP
jgi:predicted RNA polymerase sigma factor